MISPRAGRGKSAADAHQTWKIEAIARVEYEPTFLKHDRGASQEGRQLSLNRVVGRCFSNRRQGNDMQPPCAKTLQRKFSPVLLFGTIFFSEILKQQGLLPRGSHRSGKTATALTLTPEQHGC